jgi:hypothetical protein
MVRDKRHYGVYGMLCEIFSNFLKKQFFEKAIDKRKRWRYNNIMFSAIRTGKINVSPIEDTLTSTVFDNLLLLPDKFFWKIITDSCYDNSLPRNVGDIEYFEFWPHWDAIGSSNQYFVEPDLFVRFEETDIIFEAKRWDYNQQYRQQWEKELIGYKNEFGDDGKTVYFIAIGGINSEIEEELNIKEYGKVKIIKCRWVNILKTLQNIYNELENCNYLDYSNIKRIINTSILALEFHGFMRVLWLEDIPKAIFGDFEKTTETLERWRINI